RRGGPDGHHDGRRHGPPRSHSHPRIPAGAARVPRVAPGADRNHPLHRSIPRPAAVRPPMEAVGTCSEVARAGRGHSRREARAVKVAVVCNSPRDNAVINPFGRVSPEVYRANTVTLVIEGLRQGGHDVLRCPGDKTLLASLESWMPGSDDGTPGGIVFNMAYGIQGDCRYTHVPAMLEMAGVPYTG